LGKERGGGLKVKCRQPKNESEKSIPHKMRNVEKKRRRKVRSASSLIQTSTTKKIRGGGKNSWMLDGGDSQRHLYQTQRTYKKKSKRSRSPVSIIRKKRKIPSDVESFLVVTLSREKIKGGSRRK